MIHATDTHYQVLKLSPASTFSEIRRAYLTLSLQYHPDKPRGSHLHFSRIQLAYEVLRDSNRRATYDALLQHVVTDVISLEDMEREGSGQFYIDCRCGGGFTVEGELQEGAAVVGCDTCSLAIRVVGRGRLEKAKGEGVVGVGQSGALT